MQWANGAFHLNDLIKNVMLWVTIAIILMFVFNQIGGPTANINTIKYSDFMSHVETGSISEATISGREIRGKLSDSCLLYTSDAADE